MKKIKLSLLSCFMAILIVIGLYLSPVYMLTMSLPDWAFPYFKDLKSETHDTHACKKYGGGYNKFYASDLEYTDAQHHIKSSYIWIEVNNRENGISCLNAVKVGFVADYLSGHTEKISDVKYFIRDGDIIIEQVLLEKTNGLRYIILVIAVAGSIIRLNGV